MLPPVCLWQIDPATGGLFWKAEIRKLLKGSSQPGLAQSTEEVAAIFS